MFHSCLKVLVNGPQTPLATSLKPAEVDPHVPEVPLGKFSQLRICMENHLVSIGENNIFLLHIQ